MRNTKFKAVKADGSGWLYGKYVVPWSKLSLGGYAVGLVKSRKGSYHTLIPELCESNLRHEYDIDIDTLCQYVGTFNNIDVYEGDKYRLEYIGGKDGTIGTVAYNIERGIYYWKYAYSRNTPKRSFKELCQSVNQKNYKGNIYNDKLKPKLKPCPFCGHEDIEVWVPNDDMYKDIIDRRDVRVVCKNCKVQTPCYIKAETAIKEWNTRVGE